MKKLAALCGVLVVVATSFAFAGAPQKSAMLQNPDYQGGPGCGVTMREGHLVLDCT